MTSFDHLELHAHRTPGRAALVVGESTFSYGRFHADAMRFTCALASCGVTRGQIVLVSHAHPYVHWLLLVACENLGAVSVSSPDTDALGDSPAVPAADHVFAEGAAPSGARRARAWQIDGPWLRRAFDRPIAECRSHPRVALPPDAPMRIAHSSGTTGRQKAMVLRRSAQEEKLRLLGAASGETRDSRILVSMPFSVNSAWLQASLSLRLGACVVVAPLMQALGDHGVTDTEVLPLVLDAMLREIPPAFVKPARFSITVIGAPLPARLRERALGVLCTDITCRYGSNEVWPIALGMSDGAGTLCPGVEARIVDAAGDEAAPGHAGHIAVRSATMVDGYFADPEATGRHFRDGWFLTGDMGRLPRPGVIELLGRADDVLNYGGLKRSPVPLETALRAIPGVRDVAVTSFASGHAIDTLGIAAVLDGRVPQDDLSPAIRLATAEWPHVLVAPIAALPVTAMGKLDRAELRRRLMAEVRFAA